MTTMTPKRKAAKKPLRIRPELLPDSAKYATIDGREYLMIPVEDFGDWYEDALDGAVVEYVRDNQEPVVPFAEVMAEIRRDRKNAKK